ncbi:MAG: hypothetical protein FWC09_05105 [Lachnospiraceae bacterium]|nr:hypothetical protein [Lachnospiraceae bacterium]
MAKNIKTLQSSRREWDDLKAKWQAGGSVDEMIQYFEENYAKIQNAINLISASNRVGYDQLNVPKLTFTQADLTRLKDAREAMKAYAENIHDEIIDNVDTPFAKKMGEVLDEIITISPENVRVTSSFTSGAIKEVSIYELIMPALDYSNLQNYFKNMLKGKLKDLKQKPTITLQIAMVKAIVDSYEGADLRAASYSDKNRLVKYYEMIYPDRTTIMDNFLGSQSIRSIDILNIKFIAYKSPERYQYVMFKYLPDISIATINEPGTQHYSPTNRAISVNLNSVTVPPATQPYGAADGRGAYFTFFHELGHGMDHAMTGFNGNASNSLLTSIENDVYDNMRVEIEKLFPQTRTPQQENEINLIFESLKHTGAPLTDPFLDAIRTRVINEYSVKLANSSVNGTASDVYGGVTNNQINGGFGHWRVDYWYDTSGNVTGAQNREFFADNFATNVTGYEAPMISNAELFPTATIEMQNIIINERSLIIR